MNKVMTTALVAGGLLLLNLPEAAAHTQAGYSYQPPPYYHDYRGYHRAGHMPRWLHRNESFRRWYRHSSHKRDRRLAWGELFDIYRYDRRYGNGSYYRDDRRHKGRRDGRRHRH